MLINKIRRLTILLIIPLLFSCEKRTTITSGDNFEYIKLPDGSEVYLNKNSTVSYISDFPTRKLTLEGQAYFFVTPGPRNNLFLVHTTHADVVVDGTEFGVNTSTNNEDLAVQVDEGTVSINTDQSGQMVYKKQKVTYNHRTNSYKIDNAGNEFIAWLRELEKAFDEAGKEIGQAAKTIGKEIESESKKIGTELKSEGKKAGRSIKKELDKLKR